MESWDDAMAGMRGAYLRDMATRLQEMERALGRLEAMPEDRAAVDELLRGFHGFAGSGTTYGFPEVTAFGQQGERECATLKTADTAAAAEGLRTCQVLLRQLRAALDGPAGSPADARPVADAAASIALGLEILVVEDDAAVCEAVKRLAAQEGLTMRGVASAAEGRQAIDERLPDGLVVGTKLPDGPGYGLVEHLRSRPGGDVTAVLMVAEGASFLDKVDAIHCGADGYFQKPVDWVAFLRRLQHLLERQKAEPARILYVEDDPHQAAFVRTVLRSAGYEIEVCTDPKRFEAGLTAFRPDLVLMDILLSGKLSGFDLTRYVRQDERYATLPIVFLTTEAQVDVRIETARAGGDGYLEKPVVPALLLSDVAARIERARYVKALLSRDGLTGLLTHTAFLERARAALAHGRRDASRLMAWVMLDVDRFKSINDRYGHPVGDRVLARLSALLRRRLHQAETVGRYGGEEFAILVEGLGEAEAVRLVQRLLTEFAALEHLAADGTGFHATFSAGVAALDANAMDVDGWRKAADDALCAAKREGRNRVVAATKLAGG